MAARKKTTAAAEGVKPSETVQTAVMAATVALNVRKNKSAAAEILGVLEAGQAVETVNDAKTGEWVQCLTPFGKGYCMRQYLTEVV